MTGQSRKLAIASAFGPSTSAHANTPLPSPGSAIGETGEAARLAAVAHAEYRSRRRRERLFNAHIFAEPAWDIILDLYVQRHHARPVSIHSLCIAAAVPQTTALRWIGKLDLLGFLKRSPCPHDNRVILVTLSEYGVEVMEDYLRGQFSETAEHAGFPMSFS